MPVLITLVIQSLLMVDFAVFKLNRKPFGKTMEEVDFSLNRNMHDVWLVNGSNWNIINISKLSANLCYSQSLFIAPDPDHTI